MTLRKFLFISLTCIYSATVAGQTIRVSAGVSANGCRSYKEVYEYDYVEHKPTFPGGDVSLVAFINEHRQYPEQAYKEGIQGRVICAFVVNTDGSVSNVSVLKGVEGSLNKEAVRIISQMPDWTPGMLNGRPVPVRVIYPVPFRK